MKRRDGSAPAFQARGNAIWDTHAARVVSVFAEETRDGETAEQRAIKHAARLNQEAANGRTARCKLGERCDRDRVHAPLRPDQRAQVTLCAEHAAEVESLR